MSHADTIRHALAVLLQECGESPSTEAGLAYSGAHRAVNQLEALAAAEAPAPQRWEYRQFKDNEITTRLNDPGEAWELASPPFAIDWGGTVDVMALLRRPAAVPAPTPEGDEIEALRRQREACIELIRINELNPSGHTFLAFASSLRRALELPEAQP